MRGKREGILCPLRCTAKGTAGDRPCRLLLSFTFSGLHTMALQDHPCPVFRQAKEASSTSGEPLGPVSLSPPPHCIRPQCAFSHITLARELSANLSTQSHTLKSSSPRLQNFPPCPPHSCPHIPGHLGARWGRRAHPGRVPHPDSAQCGGGRR